MSQSSVYKQKKVIVSAFGIPITGIPEDEEITIEYDREHVSKKLDVNDGGMFAVRAGKPARITVPILPNSRWVGILNGYKAIDKMVPITITDANPYNSASTFISADSLIQDSSATYGAETTSRSFIFEVMNLIEINIPEL